MRPARRTRDERGSASAQAVLTVPALVLVLLLVVQVALYQHASHVVTAAAQHGATAAQAEQGSAGAGESAARSFLAQTASGLLSSSEVRISRDRNTAHVVVNARVVALVPGLSFLTVRGEADGPVERFFAPDER